MNDEKLKQEIEKAQKRNIETQIQNMIKKNNLGKRFLSQSFENFKVNENNKKAFEYCKNYAENFSSEHKGILMSGNYGIGKTHLLAGITNKLIQNGKKVYYGRLDDLSAMVREDIDRIDNQIQDIANADFLAIDDLGKEKATDFAVKLFGKLVDLRNQDMKGICLATNLTCKTFAETYGGAVMSRIYQMCEFYRWEDKDWRKR